MAAVIAAAIAAIVATFGYVTTARAKLLEDRRATYAAALSKVLDYEALPHRIRRRPDSSCATRGKIGELITDIQRDMRHYSMLLWIDSDQLGMAYDALVAKAQGVCEKYRTEAWGKPPPDADEQMGYPELYQVNDSEQRDLCIKYMREHLALWSWKQVMLTVRKP
jgi:hypothetical protein